MREFTCGLCGKTFTSDPDFTEDQRIAEMKGHFGDVHPTERVSVCSSCYEIIDPARHPHLMDEERRRLASSGAVVVQPDGSQKELTRAEAIDILGFVPADIQRRKDG
jgi:hypothetical protein